MNLHYLYIVNGYQENETSTTKTKDEKRVSMRILHQTITPDQQKDGGLSLIKRTGSLATKLSESFWFILSFLLFIVMGPFSAIAVVLGLWSLATSEECRDHMVEPASS
jgi:hypothetical protein